MDRLNSVCFNTDGENNYKPFGLTGNLTEDNIIELLDYYYPSLIRGNIRKFIENINNAKISFGELVYLAEKTSPHLQTIRDMVSEIPSQVDVLDLAIEIFINTDINCTLINDERSVIAERLKNITSTSEMENEFPKYFTKDEIGYYTISPLYSIINYVDFDSSDSYQVMDNTVNSEEEMILYERNSSLFNRVS